MLPHAVQEYKLVGRLVGRLCLPVAACAPTHDVQEYKLVGRVVGRFYDAAGHPTTLLARAEAAAAAAAAAKQAEQAGQAGSGTQAHPCNVKWSKNEGVGQWVAGRVCGYAGGRWVDEWVGVRGSSCSI